jgi:hypothetical protein
MERIIKITEHKNDVRKYYFLTGSLSSEANNVIMKILEVKKETFERKQPDLSEVSARLDSHGPGELIDILNWENYNYRPDVWFNIAYTEREILLKYYVNEAFIKAEKTESNQMVCEDSCVEFFVSPAEDRIYYNFEFNPIGTCLLGAGTCRKDSSLAPVSVIDGIRRMGSSGTKPFKEKKGKHAWSITVAIPKEAFFRHKLKDFYGKIFRANFYKCGDKLAQPHYLTWNPVGTKNPDYHQPDFFGVLKFI